jgi:hypothetical protein
MAYCTRVRNSSGWVIIISSHVEIPIVVAVRGKEKVQNANIFSDHDSVFFYFESGTIDRHVMASNIFPCR